MVEIEQVKSDIGYVRRVLQVSERGVGIPEIYYLWAAIVLVGFSLVDFVPGHVVGLYWTFAAPAGFALSAVFGWRESLRSGQVRRDEGIRSNLYWLGMMVALFAVVVLGVVEHIPSQVIGRIQLLIIALTYFYSGVHGERPLLWVGLLMMAGYVGFFFSPPYGWTIIGILVAVALTVSGLLERKKYVSSHD